MALVPLLTSTPAIIASIVGVLGFKIGQDTAPNPPTVPNDKSSISILEIGFLLIFGFMAIALIRLLGGLFK